MSRRKKQEPAINLAELLNRKVTVKINGVKTKLEPFAAQFEQCAMTALRGDIRACTKFINWCLRAKIIAAIEPFDDHQYTLTIPKDWDYAEFMAEYEKRGPPPWMGLRDGLTVEARERLTSPQSAGGHRND